jgi:hypothetical protein
LAEESKRLIVPGSSVEVLQVNSCVYRSPRLAAPDYQIMKDYGFTHIMNLEDDSEAVKFEMNAAEKVGISIISIPMYELTSHPDPNLLIRGVQFIRTIFPKLLILSKDILRVEPIKDPNITEGDLIDVHCKHGKDRIGLMIALINMVFDGWTVEDATNEMKAWGHKWYYPVYWFWRKSILEAYDKMANMWGKK